jgi:hypothetical protein
MMPIILIVINKTGIDLRFMDRPRLTIFVKGTLGRSFVVISLAAPSTI